MQKTRLKKQKEKEELYLLDVNEGLKKLISNKELIKRYKRKMQKYDFLESENGKYIYFNYKNIPYTFSSSHKINLDLFTKTKYIDKELEERFEKSLLKFNLIKKRHQKIIIKCYEIIKNLYKDEKVFLSIEGGYNIQVAFETETNYIGKLYLSNLNDNKDFEKEIYDFRVHNFENNKIITKESFSVNFVELHPHRDFTL